MRGIELARQVGGGLGPFARVVTSPAPRARETAEAMGFRVDAAVEGLLPDMSGLWTGQDYESAATLADYADAVDRRPDLRTFARTQARLWLTLLTDVPEEGALLAISHGGVVEFGALGILPDGPQRNWGPCFGLCEGVAISVDAGRPVRLQPLRV